MDTNHLSVVRLTVASRRRHAEHTGVLDLNLLGKKIKERRLRLGLSQGEVATKAGIAINTLRTIEKGRWRVNWDKVVAVGTQLGFTADQLTRADEPITEDHPLLTGLNDDDLRVAQAYSRARTPTRLRIDRLLARQADPGFELLERIDRLADDLRQTLLDNLSQFEAGQRQREADALKRKDTPEK